MPHKREVYINHRPQMVDVTYWPESDGPPDYIIVMDDKGQEHIARQAMGAWMAFSPMDLIILLKWCDRLEKQTEQ